MSFEIKTIENFDRQAHRLAKHYPSFREDYKALIGKLKKNPLAGTDITYSADIILKEQEGQLILLSVYDKSEQSSISDKEIKRLKKLLL